MSCQPISIFVPFVLSVATAKAKRFCHGLKQCESTEVVELIDPDHDCVCVVDLY